MLNYVRMTPRLVFERSLEERAGRSRLVALFSPTRLLPSLGAGESRANAHPPPSVRSYACASPIPLSSEMIALASPFESASSWPLPWFFTSSVRLSRVTVRAASDG